MKKVIFIIIISITLLNTRSFANESSINKHTLAPRSNMNISLLMNEEVTTNIEEILALLSNLKTSGTDNLIVKIDNLKEKITTYNKQDKAISNAFIAIANITTLFNNKPNLRKIFAPLIRDLLTSKGKTTKISDILQKHSIKKENVGNEAFEKMINLWLPAIFENSQIIQELLKSDSKMPAFNKKLISLWGYKAKRADKTSNKEKELFDANEINTIVSYITKQIEHKRNQIRKSGLGYELSNVSSNDYVLVENILNAIDSSKINESWKDFLKLLLRLRRVKKRTTDTSIKVDTLINFLNRPDVQRLEQKYKIFAKNKNLIFQAADIAEKEAAQTGFRNTSRLKVREDAITTKKVELMIEKMANETVRNKNNQLIDQGKKALSMRETEYAVKEEIITNRKKYGLDLDINSIENVAIEDSIYRNKKINEIFNLLDQYFTDKNKNHLINIAKTLKDLEKYDGKQEKDSPENENFYTKLFSLALFQHDKNGKMNLKINKNISRLSQSSNGIKLLRNIFNLEITLEEEAAFIPRLYKIHNTHIAA